MIGLILLGAALSRLKIQGLPRGYWKSAVGMAVLKLIVGMSRLLWVGWKAGLTPISRANTGNSVDQQGHDSDGPSGAG